VLAPGIERERLAEGRARLAALELGNRYALMARLGEPLAVTVGRALPAGGGRRVAGPFDLAANLETALSRAPFDVVHLHEPLAPSPALSTLRHAAGVTAATFHRTEPLAGVAFLRALVDRALARVDLRVATQEASCRTLAEVLPGRYEVIPGGVDVVRFAPPAVEPGGPPGLVIVARGRDRVGVRFALRVLRGLDLAAVGPVTVIGAAEAPWRTRAAVPKALRDVVTAVPDGGSCVRAEALARGRIALFATPEDVCGPVLREAMAAGLAVLAPRCPELEDRVEHGREALALAPFSLAGWVEAVAGLAAEHERRAELGRGAAARARARTWDVVARELDGAYRRALAGRASPAGASRPRVRIVADLRVNPGPGLPPETLVSACLDRGIGAVVVAAEGGLDHALATAAAAPPELTVVVGQQIRTSAGVIVGLFLHRAVEDGLPLAVAVARVRDQGGLVLVPHPSVEAAPAAEALREPGAEVDCYEMLTAGLETMGVGEDAAHLMQRMGLLATAGSGATTAGEVGTACVRMQRFHGPQEFLAALAEAELVRRRRGLRTRAPRGQRRHRRGR
jgi:glycosyltransferase involved in cell wall biosynthesis